MAGMAAEGREIPIADRELTRGRRGTHSDRAHHHRRWFRAPARCRPEAGVPSRPCAFAQLGVRGFDRLPAVDAGRRPALRRPRAFAQLGYAVSTASRRSMPVGDRRSTASRRSMPSALLLSWGYAVSTASRRSMPVGDRRSAVRALLLSWGYAVSTASRRSMPVGDRRSAVRALLLSWGYAVSTASRRSMPVGDRRSKPSPRLFALDDARSRCASRSEKSGLRSQSPETSPLRNSSSRVGSKKLSGISIPLSIPTGRCFTGVGGSGRISTISTFLRHSTTRSPRKAASTIWERCALASPRFTRIIVVLAQRSGTGGPKARSSSTTMTPFSST